MATYEDLIVSYWELPKESQVLVADLNRFGGRDGCPRIAISRTTTESRSGRRSCRLLDRLASPLSTA